MNRDFDTFATKKYDVIVVGAGVYGGVLACHLANAGAKILVVDKGDFCGATSANSLKVLHGGLRYLQHLNFKRMRESILSRRQYMRVAPHLTKPQGCLIPTMGSGLRSRCLMAMAIQVNNCISHDRNVGLASQQQVPPGTTMDRSRMHRAVPGMEEDATGGALWYDGLAVNSERLVLEHLLAAKDQGADLANYLRVDRIDSSGGKVKGILATDQLTGRSHGFQADWVVNVAGPWYDRLLKSSGIATEQVGWAKAINLVVSRPLHPEYAVGLEGLSTYTDQDSVVKRNKRFFFLVPWRGGTMIGTTYKPFTAEPDSLRCEQEDIDEILVEVNGIYPKWGLKASDVTFYHTGLVPMTDTELDASGQVQLAKHSRVIDHGQEGGPQGLISIRTIKYTTAPIEAAQVTRMITGKDGVPSSMTTRGQSSGALSAEQQALMPMLEERYGQRAGRVLDYLEGQEWTWWLNRQPDLLLAEVRYFIHEELACTLADVILRRCDLGTQGKPGPALLERIVRLMAAELGWDEQRKARELALVDQIYAPVAKSGQDD